MPTFSGGCSGELFAGAVRRDSSSSVSNLVIIQSFGLDG